MRWLYTLQQRLALTDREVQALAFVAALLTAGIAARYADAHWSDPPPPPRALLSAVPPSPAGPSSDTLAALTSVSTDTPAAALPTPPDSAAADPPPTAPVNAAATDGPRMNLNTASTGMLQRLPGIGPRLAERIVAHRTTHGAFRSVEELTRVKGIGAKTLERLRPMLAVE